MVPTRDLEDACPLPLLALCTLCTCWCLFPRRLSPGLALTLSARSHPTPPRPSSRYLSPLAPPCCLSHYSALYPFHTASTSSATLPSVPLPPPMIGRQHRECQ